MVATIFTAGFTIVLLAIALVLLIPISVLVIECIAALLPKQSSATSQLVSRKATNKTAILIPAHNEEAEIGATLNALLPQLTSQDTLVVVADNCSDETAAIARSCGATVVERHDLHHKGKGYALDYGLRYLSTDPPDVVVFVDADCTVHPGAIAQIARLATYSERPVQGTYLMELPCVWNPKHAVSVLAFTVKNLVRPLGLNRLNQPCLLTGTGMAFPWLAICSVSLASGNIVEDMQLGLDLAIAGYPPLFCVDAKFTGRLPQQAHAEKSQRTRWEHGHLQTLFNQVPRLLNQALRQRRAGLAAIALDLCIPPLSLLVMAWVASLLLALGVALVGASWLPVRMLLFEGGLMLIAIAVAWGKFARSSLPLAALLAIPVYVLQKIPLYAAFLIRPQTEWIRTERDVD